MIILRNKNYSHNVMPPKKDGDPYEVKVITTNFKGHEEGTDPEYMDPKTRKEWYRRRDEWNRIQNAKNATKKTQ